MITTTEIPFAPLFRSATFEDKGIICASSSKRKIETVDKYAREPISKAKRVDEAYPFFSQRMLSGVVLLINGQKSNIGRHRNLMGFIPPYKSPVVDVFDSPDDVPHLRIIEIPSKKKDSKGASYLFFGVQTFRQSEGGTISIWNSSGYGSTKYEVEGELNNPTDTLFDSSSRFLATISEIGHKTLNALLPPLDSTLNVWHLPEVVDTPPAHRETAPLVFSQALSRKHSKISCFTLDNGLLYIANKGKLSIIKPSLKGKEEIILDSYALHNSKITDLLVHKEKLYSIVTDKEDIKVFAHKLDGTQISTEIGYVLFHTNSDSKPVKPEVLSSFKLIPQRDDSILIEKRNKEGYVNEVWSLDTHSK